MSYQFKTEKTAMSDTVMISTVETLGLVSLEPRILLDAAGFVTGAEVAMEAMVAEGAELGVQAIFEDGESTAAAPVDGPWLGELAAAPVDGPWLGELAAAPVDGPWLGQLSAAPVDGPWL